MDTHSCAFCKRLVFVHDKGKILHTTPFHIDLGTVREAQEAGCRIFEHALARIEEAASKNDEVARKLSDYPQHAWSLLAAINAMVINWNPPQSEHTGPTTLALSLVCDKENPSPFSIALGFYHVFAEAGDAAASIVLTRPPNCNPASAQTFAKARIWVSSCLASHQHLPMLESLKPTRLVQIQAIEHGKFSIGLVKTSDLPVHIHYVTLSYAWGGPQPYQLTKSRLDSQATWNLENMPQTIQDAVYVTDEMGFEFLWIDSLCICQDNDEDKAREIGLMPLIYANAVMTIAAASSHGATQGFLGHRYYRSTSFPLHNLDDNSMGLLHVVEVEDKPEHLDTRGWVVQEYLLSTRLLEFSSHQVTFQCRNPSGSAAYHTDGWIQDPTKNMSRPYHADLKQVIPTNEHDAYWLWLRLIVQYSNRNLTQPTDRGLAISAAAHLLASRTPLDGYVAGLWQTKLPLDLLWNVEEPHNGILESTAKENLGPSWSWITTNRPIGVMGAEMITACQEGDSEYDTTGLDTTNLATAEVLDVSFQLSSLLAPFGIVSHGAITITGRYRSVVRLTHRPDAENDMKWLCADLRDSQAIPVFAAEIHPDAANFTQGITTTSSSTLSSLYGLLEIAKLPSNKASKTQILGLILKRVDATISAAVLVGDDGVGGVERYRRVGMFVLGMDYRLEEAYNEVDPRALDGIWEDKVVCYLDSFEERIVTIV